MRERISKGVNNENISGKSCVTFAAVLLFPLINFFFQNAVTNALSCAYKLTDK